MSKPLKLGPGSSLPTKILRAAASSEEYGATSGEAGALPQGVSEADFEAWVAAEVEEAGTMEPGTEQAAAIEWTELGETLPPGPTGLFSTPPGSSSGSPPRSPQCPKGPSTPPPRRPPTRAVERIMEELAGLSFLVCSSGVAAAAAEKGCFTSQKEG